MTNVAGDITATDVAQIVTSVFGTMMNLEAGAGITPWFPSRDRITGSVQLTGDWNGAVLLECDQVLACRFAGCFLCMDPPAVVDDTVRDALGELANVIGGNLKSVIARQSSAKIRLSIPTVVDGGDYSLRICGAELRERIPFRCEEGPFWITVLAAKRST